MQKRGGEEYSALSQRRSRRSSAYGSQRRGVAKRIVDVYAPAEWLRVVGDRIQLQQAILNLVLNAFDAASESEDLREVSISLTADKEPVKLAVRDTGSGIDPLAIDHIFEPFFSTKPDGMGMGLAIARSIVKAHGGQISARRNPDRGSTFEITLPVLQEKI